MRGIPWSSERGATPTEDNVRGADPTCPRGRAIVIRWDVVTAPEDWLILAEPAANDDRVASRLRYGDADAPESDSGSVEGLLVLHGDLLPDLVHGRDDFRAR